ncbi:Pre-mRNA cleavage complex II protein Clp1-domain-containing protein [Fimicolochytrium jonesii]|uniref:Pre-mRNA cleavage complex II protein Clp1-domain-containing protein n=1 Tax=Fimicolochytrium jonesii TaxID=1396493 RepID=UPI0022FDE05D|nr:Pre-mRNA cleavage complex II protein Clp1-domain-containing protein [Fimicolochytrium jonesii]KAI8822629.1 Pre-mRNA cleavage complex II protein Clp1-domain-containing protein [Fimicolochytrium jonesii]
MDDNDSARANQNTGRILELRPGQELRFENDFSPANVITLKLKSGHAEVFGSELATDPVYSFSGRKVAVYTWHGCQLQVGGTPTVEYIADETPMQSYLNVHMALEQMRAAAEASGEEGPRVLIVGPADVGKTSLSKILLNYAVKQGRKPIFVDIDPNEGSISLPGTLTAMAIGKPIDMEEEFSASSIATGTSPLVYYYGYPSPLDKPKLYNTMVQRLATTVRRKLGEADVKASGFIINTPSQFVDVAGYESLSKIIEGFGVNAILVIGHERLYSELRRRCPDGSGISIVKLAKSGGVVTRDKTFRRHLDMHRIKEYFYGTQKADLSPYSSLVSFSDVAIRKVGEGTLAPSSALPIGSERLIQETRLAIVDPGDILLHSVLALSNASIPDDAAAVTPEEESAAVLGTNLAGFVYVSMVDEGKAKMTVLAPNPGRLPRKYMIMASLKYRE